jgi:hypothetical protein
MVVWFALKHTLTTFRNIIYLTKDLDINFNTTEASLLSFACTFMSNTIRTNVGLVANSNQLDLSMSFSTAIFCMGIRD